VANTREGAYYGLGHCHAQDRLWQMQLRRLVSHGRVSTFAGEDGVNLDIFWSSLELSHWASKI